MRASSSLWVWGPALAFSLCSHRAFAQAEELENPGSVSAVQERAFRLNHELAFGVGVLPLNAFYKGVTGQVSYTYHFTDYFAWQVGRAAYSFNLDTGLTSQLLNQFGVQPTFEPRAQAIIGSDLLWSPVYGKLAVLNRSVVHVEGFLLAGFSFVYFPPSGSGATAASSLPFKPAVNVGVAGRLFSTKHVSFRLDVTDNVVFNGSQGIFHVPTIQLNAALNFGATE